ncbi:MAG: hypothetical protein IJQ68_09970 [Methanobrevibacter sp.]|uniref:hypothetical protein n=1 Tax=Methanobrevibacter sp. TaxID=66852 RepID=UPI0025F38835|nr:hypothetical protein [Methanobrevibacter sp.]MBR0272293.1 hypothetical protein [Methanobrevibacter sp.]
MDNKNYILAAIIVLVVLLIAVGAYILINDGSSTPELNITVNNTTEVTNTTNVTVAENTTNNTANDTTYKVYNPQSDSYVTVIGEKYDDEVGRWYTYDEDGVRYYNTRI